MNTILQEAKSYPWHIIEYQGVQSILDWFVMSSEPSTILKMPSEHLIIDNALIEYVYNIGFSFIFYLINNISI